MQLTAATKPLAPSPNPYSLNPEPHLPKALEGA